LEVLEPHRSLCALIKRPFFLSRSLHAHVFCLIAFSSWDSDFRDADKNAVHLTSAHPHTISKERLLPWFGIVENVLRCSAMIAIALEL
jgi:hypothetical protein